MRRNSLATFFMVIALALTASLSGCSGGRRIIASRGLKFAELGQEMPASGAGRYKGMSMKDSLATQGEFEWRVSRLSAKGGYIYLEEDFFLHEGINRIRIETDHFRLANGLKVGMTVDDLRHSAGPWVVSPLRDYGLFDFYTRVIPGIHFLVSDPSHGMEEEAWEKYQAENFDGAARIVAIVVY